MWRLAMFIEYGSSLPGDAARPVDPRDEWLDEALAAVPLPAGFLDRVGLLAADTAAKSSERDDLLTGRPSLPRGRRRA